jgi:hypothetical protein
MAQEKKQRPLKWRVSSIKMEVDLDGTPDVTVEIVLIRGVGGDDSKLSVIDNAIRALLPGALAPSAFLAEFTALATLCQEDTHISQRDLRSLIGRTSIDFRTMSVTKPENGESGVWIRKTDRRDTSPTVDIECDYYRRVYVRAFTTAHTVRQALLKLHPFTSTLEKGGLTHLRKLRKAWTK